MTYWLFFFFLSELQVGTCLLLAVCILWQKVRREFQLVFNSVLNVFLTQFVPQRFNIREDKYIKMPLRNMNITIKILTVAKLLFDKNFAANHHIWLNLLRFICDKLFETTLQNPKLNFNKNHPK